jgi:putative hydrolase of the HAD superfamily
MIVAYRRGDIMTTHLLVDFGEVISHPQPVNAVRAMAASIGMPTRRFAERYWASRESYDRGLPAHEYWELVAGRRMPGEALQLLRSLDIESWTHLNFATIAALRDARRRGAQLTLLSNAPDDLAVEVRASAVLAELFPVMVFSAELRLAKPDAEIFDTALALAESTPADTIFIDDRWENIRAAEALGIHPHRFTTAADLRAALARIDVGPALRSRPWWPRRRPPRTVSIQE